MNLTKIKTIEQLKSLTKLTFIEGFVLLVGVVRSTIHIHYRRDKGIFYIYHAIEHDSIQELTEEQLRDSSYSNIGQTIDKEILFLKTKKIEKHGLGYNI